MLNRKLFLIVMVAMLATVTLYAGEALQLKPESSSDSDAVVRLDPDGTGLLMLHDPVFGKAKANEATAMLRIADQVNPGLLVEFFQRTANLWVEEGLVTVREDGSFNWGDQANYDYLNARLNAEVIGQLRAYSQTLKETLTPAEVEGAVWARGPNQILIGKSLATLDGFKADWFIGRAVSSTTCETTECEKCDDVEDGSAYCSYGYCVVGCDTPCSNCTTVEVPIPPTGIDIQLRR